MNDHESFGTPAGGPPPAGAAPGVVPPPGRHEVPPGTGFMNVVRWGLFAGLLVLATVSIASYVMWRRSESRPAGATMEAKAKGKVIYQCPMHPSYTSDKPGECPICGMTLEPVTQGEHAADVGHQGNVPGLTSVNLSPERVQMIGVRTAVVRRTSFGGQLELVGFVAPEETRLRRIQLRTAGWVQNLRVNQTGERVRAGQPLLDIYSPELYQSEQEYLIERAAADSLSGHHDAGAGRSAAARLRLLGVPEEEIRRLDRERTASTRLTLRSPVNGTVLERGVTEGQYVSADTPLFSLADLSRVWVLADLYELDYTKVRVGDVAEFTADALPNRAYRGAIQFVYPTVSNETRTLKARLALDNRDGLLRPGMYGRVRVRGRGTAALEVPAEAVVNTGEHSYVFLVHGGGHFEPRMVTTGSAEGERVQILSGIAEGDTVVASASFLIDSESRLKAAISGMGAQPGASSMPGMSH